MSQFSSSHLSTRSNARLIKELLFFVNVFAGTIAFTILSFTVIALLIAPFI